MASEDVIELGSSDDEVEPPPKKKKTIPNAMVHIPTNLHGVTIKPTTSKGSTKVSPKNTAFTVAKVAKCVNPLANKNKPNGKAIQKVVNLNAVSVPTSKVTVNKTPSSQGVNPMNLFKKLNSQVVINKVPSATKIVKNPIRIQSPRTINNLPSSITVTRAPGMIPVLASKPVRLIGSMKPDVRHLSDMKHSAVGLQAINKKKVKPRPVKMTNEVLTVDLDDDDTGSSTSSPQWYLRPEDEDKKSLEEENNKEPEQSKCVEITIEDSPVKPKSVKTIEEFSVTIEDSPVKLKSVKTVEDSPVKPLAEKKTAPKSDEEDNSPRKSPQSKKKLQYPKEYEEKQVIEIEFEPIDVDESVKINKEKEETAIQNESDDSEVTATLSNPKDRDFTETQSKPKDKDVTKVQTTSKDTEIVTSQPKPKDKEVIAPSIEIVEIEESPLKEAETRLTSTPKKNHNKPAVKFPMESLEEDSAEYSEFHLVYRNFIKTCFLLENSEDMKKIVEKKVKTYYRQVPKEYTESEQFIDMVSSKILAMKAGPDKMYLYIKDIVDELNLQRKMAKTQPSKTEKEKADKAESDNFLYGEHSEFDSKRQRQIRKLEKTLKKLHRAIQKLEEQEVDFDDEEDSVYLLTERYKERMMRVHAKFCQLTNTKMPSEPRVQLDPRPGHPPGPAKRLEKWINKKVPIGTPLPFPDFHDVLRCVKEANEDDNLGWNDVDIMEEARDLFTRCGKKLQRRRQENEWRTAVSRISLDADPAEENEDLRRKLEQNKQVASKKEVEVFNKFADKQNQLKLEAEEIGDKEAEESPVESEEDEEETVDEESLENKDKRKERLRRLLQEKSKKNSDEKENEPIEVISNSQPNEEIKESTTTSKDVEMKLVEDVEIEQNKAVHSKKEETAPESSIDDPNEKAKKDSSKKVAEIEDTNILRKKEKKELESDIDELHLLEKLYSENEVNSSTVDSDSDAPISISDTLDSENADKKSVISIENSSYSESEMNKIVELDTDEDLPKLSSDDSVSIPNTEIIKEAMDTNTEIECSQSGIQKKQVQTNNDEYNESIEDILLASSDDESTGNGDITKCKDNDNNVDNPKNLDVSENIKKPSSIGSVENPGSIENPGSVENPESAENPLSFDVPENVENPGSIEILGSVENPGSVENTGSIENPGSVEDAVNLKDDNLSIGETVVGDENSQNMEQNVTDSPSDKNIATESGNSNGDVSDNAVSSNNENMDISEDVSQTAEDVISLDADSAMQSDEVLCGEDVNDGINDKIMSTNDKENDDAVQECVSLDEDSSACDTVIENNEKNDSDLQNIDEGNIESDLQSQGAEKIESDSLSQNAEEIDSDSVSQHAEKRDSDPLNEEGKKTECDSHSQDAEKMEEDVQYEGQKVSTVSEESCSNDVEVSVNDTINIRNVETIDNRMIVDEDLESDVLNNKSSNDDIVKDNVNDCLRESKLTDGITIQTTT